MSDTPLHEKDTGQPHQGSEPLSARRGASLSASPTDADTFSTDEALRAHLRSELRHWTRARRSIPEVTSAPRSTETHSFIEQQRADGSTEYIKVPVYKVSNPPATGSSEWLRQKSSALAESMAEIFKGAREFSVTGMDAVSLKVSRLVNLLLGLPDTSQESDFTQKNLLGPSLNSYGSAYPRSTNEQAQSILLTKSVDDRPSASFIAQPTVNAVTALSTVKEALIAFVEAVRSAEKKRSDSQKAEVELHRKELEKAIEHLKSLDSGPTNPILQDLIAAMSSSFAPMDPQTAEQILRLAEIDEELAEQLKVLAESETRVHETEAFRA